MIGTDGHNKKNISAFLRSNALTITIQLVGLVVVVANLWIATKLAPVAQDLAVLIQRVSAIEETINYHTKELDELKGTATEVSHINKQLDSVEGKIDKIIFSGYAK